MTFLKDYHKNIDKITTKDMQAVASKYLNHKLNNITVIQMPEDDDD